jgi:hypothetical protein
MPVAAGYLVVSVGTLDVAGQSPYLGVLPQGRRTIESQSDGVDLATKLPSLHAACVFRPLTSTQLTASRLSLLQEVHLATNWPVVLSPSRHVAQGCGQV